MSNLYNTRNYVKKAISIAIKLLISMIVVMVSIMPLSANAIPVEEVGNPVDWTPYGGTWTVGDSVYSVSYDGGYPNEKRLIDFGSVYTDLSMEADITFSGNGGNAGFIVRVSDPLTDVEYYGSDKQNAYYIGIDSSGTGVHLGKTRITSYEHTVSVETTPNPDNTYHLKVVLSGNLIQVYVDDILKFNYTDEYYSFTSGMVGLRSFLTDASYSNVVISTIPATTISQTTNETTKFVTVNLLPSEPSTSYYQINNGPIQTGGSFVLQTNGIHFITYWSGNEAPHREIIKVNLNSSSNAGSVNIADVVKLLNQNEINTFSTNDIQLMLQAVTRITQLIPS